MTQKTQYVILQMKSIVHFFYVAWPLFHYFVKRICKFKRALSGIRGMIYYIHLPPAGNLGRLVGLMGYTGLLAEDKETHMFNIELWLLVSIGN